MGTYVNPGNQAFAEISDKDYVDKTGLINLINQTIGSKNKLTCISRPRRFGKSWAARMLTAYYDCTCDSKILFDQKIIGRTKLYQTYLNQFNVICLDISGFISSVKAGLGSYRDVPGMINRAVWKDLIEQGFVPDEGDDLNDFLLRCVNVPDGKPFVFIIDEWDALIREAKNDDVAQEAYLNLLRGWFKNINFTPKAVAAAYMTGILPIKKDGSQSAISDFKEFSILSPGQYASFTGFSEAEVKRICKRKKMSFEELKTWYDGYELPGSMSIYNPYSVMQAVETKRCRSFWRSTSAAAGLSDYIKMNFDGLQETVAILIAGSEVTIDTEGFQNDMERFSSKDDILTLLIHLGYLTYDSEKSAVRIPNEEVRTEFRTFLTKEDVGEHWMALIKRSNSILSDTIAGNADGVAKALEEIRAEQYAPQYYNNEQSLRAIIKYAYLSAIGKYVKVEEMPSGKGLADVVFIPASSTKLPAMVIELKWNKTAGGAIEQIKKKNYFAVLHPFKGNIILCGINYDERTGNHFCEIERA